MKKEILLILTLCSVLMNIALGMELCTRKPNCEHVHLDEIDRTKDVVPNEKVAEQIAEIFIRSQEDHLTWGRGIEYGVEVTYDESRYEWMIHYDANANWSCVKI